MSAYIEVVEKIHAAERQYGRARGSVQLIAVSKTRSPEDILAVVAQGQRHFGENYLQEALPKIAALASSRLDWHYIGSIQSNKAADIAQHFAWVHTVDRIKVAQRLNEQRDARRGRLQVCIQVNLSGEASKSGVAAEAVPLLAEQIRELPRLQLRGLMTLPAPEPEFDAQRRVFRQLAGIQDALRHRGFDLDTLSMGMSGDFEAAIAEGATMVRIGSSIFGPRPPKA